MMEIPELNQNAAKQRNQKEEIKANTAFLVVLTPEGMAMALPDLDAVNVVVDHKPSDEEVEMLCGKLTENVKANRQAAITAQMVVGGMQQAAQKFQEQGMNQQLLERIQKNRGNFPG